MARRGRNDIEVAVVGEADFGRARRDAARDLDRIERDARDAAKDIERAFDRVELSPELDTSEIRQALDLADQLDGMVARFDVDTDLAEIREAERIARSLRSFQGRVDLSVDGRQELADALDLAEKMDQIRQVKVQVQGQQDLERAQKLADDLERRRTVPIDARAEDLVSLDEQITEAGERGAEGIADAISGIDFDNIGGAALDQLSGALAAAGPWAAAAGAIAAVFGDELVAGISREFNRQRTDVIRAIQSGASPEQLAIAGEAAGDAYRAGFGESLQQLESDADQLVSILGDLIDPADLDEAVKQSQVLASVLGVDVTQAAELARRAVRQGLADDWQDAFDDMIGVTQEFGATGVETLDILEEFGGNFARFEVDGGQAIRFVASAMRDGLVPTIDRAGEAFEEFVTGIIDADAQEAIEELGLDFAEIQQAVARGGDEGRRAMIQVIEALADYGTEADRARLRNEIFAGSLEMVSDDSEFLRRLLGLLTDETDAYAGKATEVTEALEEQQTAWSRINRGVEEGAAAWAEWANRGLDAVLEVNDAVETLVDGVVGVLLPIRDVGDELTATSGAARDWSGTLNDAKGGAGGLADASDRLADALGGVEDAAVDVRDALDDLFGFQADRLMRDIAEAGDDLADALDGDTAALVGMNGAIDISTAEGRRLQTQLERLSEALIDAEVAYQNGEISAGELAAAQSAVRREFDRVTGSSRLTTDQIEALRRKYVQVADLDRIDIEIRADVFDAIVKLNNVANLIERIPNFVPVNVGGSGGGGGSSRPSGSSGTTTTTRTGRSGFITYRAKGGPATGLTLVGEEGPELVDFGSARAMVHNAADTRQFMNRGTTGPGGPAAVLLDIRSGGSALDDLLVEVLRKAIRNRGGGVVQVLG